MCEISVIVPVYNKKRYIKKAVKSVLNQTFEDFELLLIDDGSTDGSGAVCDDLSELDQRIKVFHTPNHGVSAARNLGIKNAKGRFVGFIDADDSVHKTFLEKLFNSITRNDSGLAVCNYYEVKNGKKTIHILKNYNSGCKEFEFLRQDILCILWNKLYVRNNIQHLFDESISTCEDSVFCIHYYIDNHPKVSFVNETLYGYVVHDDGLTSTIQRKALRGIDCLFTLNRSLSEQIQDERIKKLAIHHICKVYYYGIYTYIFENLSKGSANEALTCIEHILNHRKYRRIIRYILRYRIKDGRAEKTGPAEWLIIIFSLLKMKRAVYFVSKGKVWLKSKINRW